MMKLENQVCSLEQARRFHELGIGDGINTLFVWHNLNLPEFVLVSQDAALQWANIPKRGFNVGNVYPAFTVAELGMLLPAYYSTWLGNTDMGEVCWVCGSTTHPELYAYGDSEPQCKARMLLRLLQSNVITPAEVNTRLQ